MNIFEYSPDSGAFECFAEKIVFFEFLFYKNIILKQM